MDMSEYTREAYDCWMKITAENIVKDFPEREINNEPDVIFKCVDESIWFGSEEGRHLILEYTNREPCGSQVILTAGPGSDWRVIKATAACISMQNDLKAALDIEYGIKKETTKSYTAISHCPACGCKILLTCQSDLVRKEIYDG